jgi:aspartate/glutamate racemase
MKTRRIASWVTIGLTAFVFLSGGAADLARPASLIEGMTHLGYTRPLGQLGIACETMDPGSRGALDKAIFRLMEGRDDAESAAAARGAVATLRARGVDGVILGCTEIPLLLRESADAADLINPAELLSEAAVRAAVK